MEKELKYCPFVAATVDCQETETDGYFDTNSYSNSIGNSIFNNGFGLSFGSSNRNTKGHIKMVSSSQKTRGICDYCECVNVPGIEFACDNHEQCVEKKKLEIDQYRKQRKFERLIEKEYSFLKTATKKIMANCSKKYKYTFQRSCLECGYNFRNSATPHYFDFDELLSFIFCSVTCRNKYREKLKFEIKEVGEENLNLFFKGYLDKIEEPSFLIKS